MRKDNYGIMNIDRIPLAPQEKEGWGGGRKGEI